MVYRYKGFTLIELMITLAIFAILLTIAIPSFTSQIRNNKSVSIATEFTDLLGLARTEAVMRRERVSVCSSDTGDSCSGDWNDGFIVFVDTAAVDTAAAPEVGVVLKYWQPPTGEVQFDVAYGEAATSFFRYTSIGSLARISTDPLTATVKLIGCTGQYARRININASGQASVQPEDC